MITSDGKQYWYKNGERHRDGDLPATIYPNGTKTWYKNGTLHRENDLPAVIWPDGTQKWFKNGKEFFQPKLKL
jgi:antitoxin component YwqK of YwqJK toxin-antitoxin module